MLPTSQSLKTISMPSRIERLMTGSRTKKDEASSEGVASVEANKKSFKFDRNIHLARLYPFGMMSCCTERNRSELR